MGELEKGELSERPKIARRQRETNVNLSPTTSSETHQPMSAIRSMALIYCRAAILVSIKMGKLYAKNALRILQEYISNENPAAVVSSVDLFRATKWCEMIWARTILNSE